jgi:class 3 adenylate cyclase/uncharacterized membrane protein affecting hemolysin expression
MERERTINRFWRDLPVASKMASLMSLLVLVSVLAVTLVSILRERENFRAELENQADLLLETTSLTMRDELYKVQLDELLDVSRNVSDNPNVTDFIVYDREGRILAHSAQELAFSQEIDPLGSALVALPQGQTHMDWQENKLVAGRAVILGNQAIGAVAAGLSTAPLDQKIGSITTQGILLALITLIVGGLLTVIFSRQITHPLTELADVAAQMSDGDLSIRVRTRSRDEIGRLGRAFNEMAIGLQEREWLRDTFGRFVSREVVDAIRTGQVQLQGEHRMVSVLFCDIREFTDFSERHTPQEVVTMLNEFLPLVVLAAQKNGGTVNKFGGDSTLVIYGAPREIEDSAYRAVLTALDIRMGVSKLNARLAQNGEGPLRVGIGINTGLALAGAIGPAERQEYTVIGNAVNLAARIDGLNKQFPQHDILISGWTYEALAHHQNEFEQIPLGLVPIRGKNEPVEIWAVKGRT